MRYNYVTNYKENDILRESFNELTEKTFGFNFKDWFKNGFWGDKYIPHSLVYGDKVIANVSVNLMDFCLDGREMNCIQIGTVMTHEDYKGQGLSRYLMERVIEEYKDKIDGIYLFGNDSVIDFYPKFGFKIGKEYQYSKSVGLTEFKREVEVVDVSNSIERNKFLNAVERSVCNERLSMDNYGLITFWSMGPMSDCIYYYSDEDAYIIADIRNEILNVYHIISSCKVDLEKIISSFGSDIRKVILGFTPCDSNGYDLKEYHEEDCTFFYIGECLESMENEKLIFPTLSHA